MISHRAEDFVLAWIAREKRLESGEHVWGYQQWNLANFAGNTRGIYARWNWQRVDIPVANWVNGVVHVNTDEHWGGGTRRIREQLIKVCIKHEIPFVPYSFDAAALARIQTSTIKPIDFEMPKSYRRTIPKDSPDRLKTRTKTVWMFRRGKKPTTNTKGEPLDRWWKYPRLAEQNNYAGWRWRESKQFLVPPTSAGHYVWFTRSRFLYPATVFRCKVQTNPLDPNSTERAIFVSAMDTNDRPPRYFISRLPKKAKVKTVAEAIDALAPEAVHIARSEGRKVVRQGDIFAIKTKLKEKDLLPRMKQRCSLRIWTKITYLDRSPRECLAWSDPWYGSQEAPTIERHCHDLYHEIADRLRIHGTAHTAEEIIELEGGAIYGRGYLHHDPALTQETRDRDHQDIKLDNGTTGWWLLVRNTVPPR